MIDSVIGLGQAGCNIVKKFADFPQYKCVTLDTGLESTYVIVRQDTPEGYEKRYLRLIKLKKKITKDVLVVTSAGVISGCLLRLLQQLTKGKYNVSVLYIKPEKHNLIEHKKLQENLVFNVLQEYARSAAINKMYIVDNDRMATAVGEVPILDYYNQINTAIVNTIHMINVFQHEEPVMHSEIPLSPTSNIATFGTMEFKTGNLFLFFDLDNVRRHVVYYGIPAERLETDVSLMTTIKTQMSNYDDVDYRIHSTEYDSIYVYCSAYATAIQKNDTGLTKVLTK